jgi:hypothetical protein
MTLEGSLTVAGVLTVATIEGERGELHGPGITTVTSGITGSGLTFHDAANVELLEGVLGGEVQVRDGSRLNAHGDTVLEPGARIDSLSDNPGLFTIMDNGSLTFDNPNGFAEVVGGFANHGAVTVTAGSVLMMGADPADAHLRQFSTGSFTGSADATFTVSNTKMGTGTSLDHVTWVDHISVIRGNRVRVADSGLTDLSGLDDPPPSMRGGGELVVTDRTTGGFVSFGASLTVTVPAGEVFTMGHAALAGRARLRVYGELAQSGDIDLNNQAVLDIHGTHRAAEDGGGLVDFSTADPGVEVIHPEGRLLGGDPLASIHIVAPFVNEGTVDSGTGFIYLGPRAESPSASSGTFRADPTGTLLLGSNVAGDPALILDDALIEGAVDVSGPVTAMNSDVRGTLGTIPDGRLTLDGTTTMADGSSIAGDVWVGGQLDAVLGPTGTATLSGAEVTGLVWAKSGTLSVPSLAPTTLAEDGTLTRGQWFASHGATLDLPTVTTIDAWLGLGGPGASFGDGLANLTGTGPNGNLQLGGGVDLAVPGVFRNKGVLALESGSRLDVSAKFRQLATGWLIVGVDAMGHGQVHAAGPRDLAGKLWVQRDQAYEPPAGTVLDFITSNGAKTADDAFDTVMSPRYGSSKLRVTYGPDHVQLWVDSVG